MKGYIGYIILGIFILLAAAIIAQPSLAEGAWSFGIWLLTAMFWLFIAILIVIAIIIIVIAVVALKD